MSAQPPFDAATAGHGAAPGAVPAAPLDAVQRAILSLQNSRAALRQELVPPPAPAPSGRRSGSGLARLWWRRLRAWPAGRLVGEVAHQWWRRHPWQPLGEALYSEARGQLWPLVRRHPWASVTLAATAGALVVASRPWRWHWLDQRLRGAPGAASGWLMRQLRSAPVQATLASLLAMAAQRMHSAGAAAASAPQEAPQTPQAPQMPQMPQTPTQASPAPDTARPAGAEHAHQPLAA